MSWLVFALLAAFMWGIQYALTERLLGTMSSAGLLLIISVAGVATFGAMVAYSGEWAQFSLANAKKIGVMLVVMVLAGLVADYAITHSISEKNATLAGLVELSYPFFTAGWMYLLFREQTMNWVTATGGLVILAGVAIVAIGSRQL